MSSLYAEPAAGETENEPEPIVRWGRFAASGQRNDAFESTALPNFSTVHEVNRQQVQQTEKTLCNAVFVAYKLVASRNNSAVFMSVPNACKLEPRKAQLIHISNLSHTLSPFSSPPLILSSLCHPHAHLTHAPPRSAPRHLNRTSGHIRSQPSLLRTKQRCLQIHSTLAPPHP